VAVKLSELADALAWDWSLEWLRRQLARLRSEGWLEYESKRGQRSRYRVRLARAALLEGADLQATSKRPPTHLQPQLEVNLKPPAPSASRKAAARAGASQPATSNPRAHAEPEPEKERKPPPEGRAPARRALGNEESNVVKLGAGASAKELVGYFCERYAAEVQEPPSRRLVGQVARQVGELLRDGISARAIAGALELMLAKRLHPSTLPSLIAEAAAGPGRRGREHPADELLRQLRESGLREEGEA